jgi:hypothetical protein
MVNGRVTLNNRLCLMNAEYNLRKNKLILYFMMQPIRKSLFGLTFTTNYIITIYLGLQYLLRIKPSSPKDKPDKKKDPASCCLRGQSLIQKLSLPREILTKTQLN